MPGNFKDKEVLAKGRTCLTTCGVEEKKRGEKKGKEREVGGLQIAGGRQLHVHRVLFRNQNKPLQIQKPSVSYVRQEVYFGARERPIDKKKRKE